MPRRTHHPGKTRRVYNGIPWRGRHRLDHREVPRIIQKMIDADLSAGAPRLKPGPRSGRELAE